jgi:multiple sugar transport system permease protein
MTAAPQIGTRAAEVPRSRTGWTPARKQEALTALLFLAPFLVVYLIFMVYPFFRGIWISFHDWDLLDDRVRDWIGVLNYQDLRDDPTFWKALRNTFYFVVLTVPSMTVLSLLLALAVSGGGRIRAICRSIFFMSSVFSVTVVTLIWTMIYSTDRGLIAPIFQALGFQPFNFLGSVSWAMPSITIATLWWGVGLPMALFIAALGSIPREIYEAAELDHASRWQTFWRVTLPSIRHTLILVLVLQIVGQFQIFGQVLLMTKGGPANATITLVQYIYYTAFRDYLVGYGAAIAMVLFAIMAVFSLLQLWLGRRGDEA